MTRVRLPDGRQFAVTWSIPDEFGGMTDSMLRRSAAFSRFGGVDVDVLTFDARPDTGRLEQALRDRGVLADGVRVRNLYDWLREHPLPGGSLQLGRDVFTPISDDDTTDVRRRGDRVMSRARVDDDGRILQVDHYRDDGTLVLSDRRDTRERGTVGGRSVVLCDDGGRPVRSWRRIWPLYTAWLDALTDGRPSFMIVDSKTIARFMLTYRRPHVITAHVVHGSHRAAPDEGHPIRRSRREVFEHLEDFDLVAVLSRRQADEIERFVGHHGTIVVVPNSRGPLMGPEPSADTRMSLQRRDPDRVIMLAALTPRKRVSHAIEAVQQASARLGRPLRLDVYGDGESRDALERLIDGSAAVQLHGYDPDARRRLLESSFLLLTSRSEGFPLVLIESMAAGCLPIAYDVAYGPADLIRDGRNGVLVPAGDVEALAAALVRARTMPPRQLARMRRRAIRSARRFDDERVTRLWARELRRVAVQRRLSHSPRLRALRAAAARTPIAPQLRSLALTAAAALDRVRRVG
ncbi:glycosyltransferase [Agromyces ramosus]|uniref:Poly(Glycerol-phosphate) alpha-glucosyltransferase n=1 Tax=Agromyces ramosus TaxID=33879 RepID=A0ABU0R9B7_9MICO|nr:glycosyltransferase [Agromyces ramosus]MDQ0894674.1 poly(glycerol-phosphate) alpha-glucosyltransferase [Agromyces ramosus]